MYLVLSRETRDLEEIKMLKKLKFLKRIDWLGLYVCLALSLILLVLSGLIPEWGRWYSAVDWYRPQMNALLEGHTSLGTALSSLQA